MSEITIHRAKSVVTMEPAFPSAEAVAVRDGWVLGVGSIDELSAWGPHTIDDTFADSVIFPGFVEAHAHHLEGGLWEFEYVGWFDRVGPDGVTRKGIRSVEALTERLRELDAQMDDPTEQLVVWGLDPIYMDGERVMAHHLDAASETRPIAVFHASFHLVTVNSALMRAEGFDEGIDMPGVPAHADGRPLGELQEPAAMSLARNAMLALAKAMNGPDAARRLGVLARRTGCTTLTELGGANLANPAIREMWVEETGREGYPARLVMFHNGGHGRYDSHAALVDNVEAMRAESTANVRFGQVKIVLDGSIQGFTARLNPPGYLGDRPNGLWLYTPEEFRSLVLECHRRGVLLHVHCNGDEAVDLFLEVMEEGQRLHPAFDHRSTVQHCQLTTPSQYRRMAALGMSANIFANHIFYWGDQHRDITVGPERAARMDACRTAQREGVRFSIHSDAAVTPLGHLHTMWCAVNRVTASGEVLGPDERIDVESALRAVTIDAAHQLKLDHEIGSLHAGKRADMVALAEDPRAVDPMGIKDIEVNGTVVGGTVHRD